MQRGRSPRLLAHEPLKSKFGFNSDLIGMVEDNFFPPGSLLGIGGAAEFQTELRGARCPSEPTNVPAHPAFRVQLLFRETSIV